MSTCTQTMQESCSKDGEKAVRMVYVGLDVHKLSIRLAARSDSKWVFERTFATTDLTELRKALKVGQGGGHLGVAALQPFG